MRDVLLLHAGVADSRMWEPQLAALEGDRVARPDLPGFGDTPEQPGPFSFVDHVRPLLGERTTVVGNSLGGRVALELALTEPERVDRLVLIDAGLPDWEWGNEVRGFWEREGELVEAGDVDGAVELNVEMWLAPEASEDVKGLVREMQRRAFELQLAVPDVGPEEPFDPPASARLGEIRCPTLVVVGALDKDDFHGIADRLAAGIPGAEKVVVAGAAHLPSLERPDEFNRLLVDFLRD